MKLTPYFTSTTRTYACSCWPNLSPWHTSSSRVYLLPIPTHVPTSAFVCMCMYIYRNILVFLSASQCCIAVTCLLLVLRLLYLCGVELLSGSKQLFSFNNNNNNTKNNRMPFSAYLCVCLCMYIYIYFKRACFSKEPAGY